MYAFLGADHLALSIQLMCFCLGRPLLMLPAFFNGLYIGGGLIAFLVHLGMSTGVILSNSHFLGSLVGKTLWM